MPFSDDEFSRLPAEVQREMLDKQREQRLAAFEYQQRIKKRAVNGAAFAGIGAMVLSLAVTDNPVLFLLIGAAAGGAGWLTVWLRYKVLGGIALIGGVCVLINALGSAVGMSAPIFSIWIFYLGLGAMVGAWGDGKRGREDAGY